MILHNLYLWLFYAYLFHSHGILETLHTMNAAIFILLLSMLAFYQHDFRLTDEWDWKQKQHGLPYFSFSVTTFSLSGWQTQGSNTNKKGYDRFPRSFLFLSMPFPSFCAWSKFQLKQKARPFRTVSAPTESWANHAYPVLGLRLADLPQVASSGILCSWDTRGVRSQWAGKEGQTHILSTSPPLARMILYPIGLHLKNTSSKTEVLRNSRWQ